MRSWALWNTASIKLIKSITWVHSNPGWQGQFSLVTGKKKTNWLGQQGKQKLRSVHLSAVNSSQHTSVGSCSPSDESLATSAREKKSTNPVVVKELVFIKYVMFGVNLNLHTFLSKGKRTDTTFFWISPHKARFIDQFINSPFPWTQKLRIPVPTALCSTITLSAYVLQEHISKCCSINALKRTLLAFTQFLLEHSYLGHFLLRGSYPRIPHSTFPLVKRLLVIHGLSKCRRLSSCYSSSLLVQTQGQQHCTRW